MLFKFIMKGADFLFITMLWFLINPEAKSQNYQDNVNIDIGIKAWDPVHIKIEEKNRSAFSTPIRFTAQNSTYYKFNLTIEFIQFDNLSPRPQNRVNELAHGMNNLFTFSIQVPGMGYGYRYSYSYWLSPSNEILNEAFPYLIPLAVGKKVDSKKNYFGNMSNTFAGKAGDTIYCMRKGLVTAVPRSETLDFRISHHDCLEVLYDDGTYMIYHYLKKSDHFASLGKMVFPGQPLGQLSDSSYLLVTLMKVDKSKNLLTSQPIQFSIGNTETVPFNELDGKKSSIHPLEVITKEMNSRELKLAGKKK
jgi:hypothetical protein